MGLGSNQPKRKIYYLSPKAQRLVDNKKVVDPHFTVSMTDEQGARHTLPDEKSVSGNLLSISHGEYEYPKDSGKKIKTVAVYLVDGPALFKIEGSVNTNMMRGLMNTVTGTKYFDRMEISLYAKNDMPNLFVKNNDQKCEWRFDYKTELAPLITEAPDPQDDTKKVKIYHAVNKLLWDAWLETEPIVAEYAKKQGYDKVQAPTVTTAPVARPQAESQSLQEELDQMKEQDLQGPHSGPPSDFSAPLPDDDLPF